VRGDDLAQHAVLAMFLDETPEVSADVLWWLVVRPPWPLTGPIFDPLLHVIDVITHPYGAQRRSARIAECRTGQVDVDRPHNVEHFAGRVGCVRVALVLHAQEKNSQFAQRSDDERIAVGTQVREFID
jgi:hypothetical protein